MRFVLIARCLSLCSVDSANPICIVVVKRRRYVAEICIREVLRCCCGLYRAGRPIFESVKAWGMRGNACSGVGLCV